MPTDPTLAPPRASIPLDPTSIPAMLLDPAHPEWSHPQPFPSFLTEFRPHQVEAVEQIVDAFTRSPFVILDAPTGSGKTILAEMVRRIMRARSVYCCTTKSLQDQFLRDFPHSRVLKGRANYPTQYGEFPEVTAADCTAVGFGDSCMWCDGKSFCGYTTAKREALQSMTAVLNTSYLLAEANGPGAFGAGPPGTDASKSNARELVVLDEADELESALMGFVEVEVGQWWRKLLRIDLPQVKTERAKSNDWQEWTAEAISRLQDHIRTLEPAPTDVKRIRHKQRAGNLLSKLEMLAAELPEGGWIYDGYNRDQPTALFRPVKVDQFGPKYLWRHGQKFLLMSGSVISPGEMADSLGIDHFESVNVRLNWDPARRPVYVTPVADVTYKNMDEARPALAKAVYQINLIHPDERILVHTVSYHLTKYLANELDGLIDRPLIWYEQGRDRDEALATFRATPGAMILAPSLDRGIDLKDDECRVMVITKVPWPSMGDKQIKTRANMGRKGKLWYSVKTVRTIVQMLGRGMRHEDDAVVTYILDTQIERVLKKKSLVPEYVKSALVEGKKMWDQSEPLPRHSPL